MEFRDKAKCRAHCPVISLLACLSLHIVSTGPGVPLRERWERFMIIAPAVCEEYTESAFQQRKKSPVKPSLN